MVTPSQLFSVLTHGLVVLTKQALSIKYLLNGKTLKAAGNKNREGKITSYQPITAKSLAHFDPSM